MRAPLSSQAIEVDGGTQVISPGFNVVQALDPETMPVEVGRNSSPGRVFASHAVHGADFIIRTETGLHRIGGNR